MIILSFDIEEWFLEHQRGGCAEKYAEYDRYLDQILAQLDECGIKATFFCVGEMGRLFPQVIYEIQARGHEIGCHSNVHTWLNKMSEKDCREDTHAAVDSLEQCIGQKVLSYRAPAFSIGQNNLWAFEILVENGIERDASVFPAKRDFGGFSNFGQQKPCIIQYKGISLKEFPIAMTTVLGRQIAYSGGGYFRFFPLNFTKKTMANTEYAMCYFHIDDLVPESNGVMSKEAYESYFKESGTLKARYMRYIKSNLGKRSAFKKMLQLINTEQFTNLDNASNSIDWNTAPIIRL